MIPSSPSSTWASVSPCALQGPAQENQDQAAGMSSASALLEQQVTGAFFPVRLSPQRPSLSVACTAAPHNGHAGAEACRGQGFRTLGPVVPRTMCDDPLWSWLRVPRSGPRFSPSMRLGVREAESPGRAQRSCPCSAKGGTQPQGAGSQVTQAEPGQGDPGGSRPPPRALSQCLFSLPCPRISRQPTATLAPFGVTPL